ncbi:MAG: DUF4332 domain-containing protein [Cellvibrionaceae bacterium]
MRYLLSELFVCLIIAAVIGGIIGWLLHRFFWCKGKGHVEVSELEKSQQLVTQLKAENDRNIHLLHEARKPKAIDIQLLEVEQIEGIGKGYGKRLREMGISTVEEMLERGLTFEGRANITETTKLSAVAVESWVSIADLMRIPGAGKQFSELLEASGVKSVESLRSQNPKTLADKMKMVNDAQRITTEELPQADQLTEWIVLSKEMDVRLKA